MQSVLRLSFSFKICKMLTKILLLAACLGYVTAAPLTAGKWPHACQFNRPRSLRHVCASPVWRTFRCTVVFFHSRTILNRATKLFALHLACFTLSSRPSAALSTPTYGCTTGSYRYKCTPARAFTHTYRHTHTKANAVESLRVYDDEARSAQNR